MEEPDFFFTRQALMLGRLRPIPMPVDEEGVNVDAGWRRAPDARLAVVTPGQQAPLGVTMSLQRRLRLPAALAVLVRTPAGASDLAIARELFAFGISPAPLSVWFADPEQARSGLMLSVATAPRAQIARACDRLQEAIARYTPS